MLEPITVGIVTHKKSTLFTHLLSPLKRAIEAYPGECQIIVTNNSGKPHMALTQSQLQEAGLDSVCTVSILGSESNNISIGRNLILSNSKTRLVAFLDDDEAPSEEWLVHLATQIRQSRCAVVAGPIVPKFPAGTTAWVSKIDIHNIGNLRTGDTVTHVATGNCILDMDKVGELRFLEELGISGGEDTHFFESLTASGEVVVWCTEAHVYETIPLERSKPGYAIRRCITQGRTFRTIIISRKPFPAQIYLLIKAFCVAVTAIFIGLLFMPFNATKCAWWMKRGWTNLGKLVITNDSIYAQ